MKELNPCNSKDYRGFLITVEPLLRINIFLRFEKKIQKMKNSILVIIAALLFSCNSQNETNNTSTNADQKFLSNCITVQEYLNDFINESIDYKKYFNDTCKIRGTSFNSEGPMSVDDRISRHKEMWAKYDFAISDSINFLPGVNAETKEIDGSVRFYFDWTINNTENGKSITIPLYMSFDFDNDGKINFYQFFGDISAAISSLE
tara:strand:+ start:665 stop:1276 length:612 start_codon:yes stop_codon:yes gene_type:complete